MIAYLFIYCGIYTNTQASDNMHLNDIFCNFSESKRTVWKLALIQ